MLRGNRDYPKIKSFLKITSIDRVGWVGATYAIAWVERSEDNVQKSVLSFYRVDPGLGSKCFYPHQAIWLALE